MIQTTSSDHAIIRNQLNDNIQIISKYTSNEWDKLYAKIQNHNDNEYWKPKPIKQLIGKFALRQKPYYHKNRLGTIEDYSYIDEIIKVVGIDKTGNILYKVHFYDDIWDMKPEWCDGNWVEVPECLFMLQ